MAIQFRFHTSTFGIAGFRNGTPQGVVIRAGEILTSANEVDNTVARVRMLIGGTEIEVFTRDIAECATRLNRESVN